jgi:segregation and condensation protein B
MPDAQDESALQDELDVAEDIEPVETLNREESRQTLHALLFVSNQPLSAERLAETLGDADRDVVITLLAELRDELESKDLPYVLREIAGGFQLISRPQYAPYIRRLLRVKKDNRLSKAILETLAIIAYKQPVTRADVEAIRGVSVAYAFEALLEKRLIKVTGVAEVPGRPKLYRITDEFLIHFGIKSLKELPSIEELRELY